MQAIDVWLSIVFTYRCSVLKPGRRPIHLDEQGIPKYDRQLIYGLPALAEYIGYGTQTVRNWIKHHGLPAGKAPSGLWVCSTQAIDVWIAARNPYR